MLNLLMKIVIFYFVYQVSQILHEIGHAVAYRVVYKSKNRESKQEEARRYSNLKELKYVYH